MPGEVHLAGGNAEAADTREETLGHRILTIWVCQLSARPYLKASKRHDVRILRAMWTYLAVCVTLIMLAARIWLRNIIPTAVCPIIGRLTC